MPDMNKKDEENIEVDTGELGNEEEVDLDRDEAHKADEEKRNDFQPAPDARPGSDSGEAANPGVP